MTTPSLPARRQTDGRMARRDRTRQKIVDAHAALLRTGDLRPTAARIAEQAGVSVRTLRDVFGDMETLFQASTDYWLVSDESLRSTVDPEASLSQRIEEFCVERTRRLEAIAPAARAAALLEHTSPALAKSRRGHVQRVVDEVEGLFVAELSALPEPDAARDALVTVTSWNFWSMLRDDLGRTAEQAEAAMRRAVADLLGAD
jgi:AcrR family transcriptional regulator